MKSKKESVTFSPTDLGFKQHCVFRDDLSLLRYKMQLVQQKQPLLEDGLAEPHALRRSTEHCRSTRNAVLRFLHDIFEESLVFAAL
jgi:hypothetical protein